MRLDFVQDWSRSAPRRWTLLIPLLLLGQGDAAVGQSVPSGSPDPLTQVVSPSLGGAASRAADPQASDRPAESPLRGQTARTEGVLSHGNLYDDITTMPFAWTNGEDSTARQSGSLEAERESGLETGHLWRGQTAHLRVLNHVVDGSTLRIQKVLLVHETQKDAVTAASSPAPAPAPKSTPMPTFQAKSPASLPATGPCSQLFPELKDPHPAFLDLSSRSSISADRRTLSIVLPQSSSFDLLDADTLDVLTEGRSLGTLCIYYAVPREASSPQNASDPRQGMDSRVAALPVQVSLRSIAALWGLGGMLLTFVLLHWVLVSYWGRGQHTVLGQHQSGLWLPRRVALSMMSLTLTPTGSFSLSMAQILWWTLITGFGLTYVWAMTEQFLAITTDVLMLMGIGSTTAIISRVTSNNRTFLPDRYLGLIQARERLPKLSDLVTIDGKPSVFKFQMLLFTVLSGIMVLQGLITSCSFPALPSELITLMGISSATYVGNELAQRDIWEQVQEKVKAIEAFARLNHLSLVSRRDVEKLKEHPDIAPAVEELEGLLRQVFADDPSVQAQSPLVPPPPGKGGAADAARASGSPRPAGTADEEHISEGPRSSPV